MASIDRRTFLLTSVALATVRMRPAAGRLETFIEWMKASPADRAAALPPLVARIGEADATIHAWVQVSPQPRTGDGALAEVPFGAKDILETRGLSTEYGSPIYKGRIGTEDAAIVRGLRGRVQGCQPGDPLLCRGACRRRGPGGEAAHQSGTPDPGGRLCHG